MADAGAAEGRGAAPGGGSRGWGLRMRIALFFALVAAAAVVLFGGALAMIAMSPPEEAQRALSLFGGGGLFALLGLIVWVALKFDENIAVPVERIGRDARAAAFGGAGEIDARGSARYLGALGPAAQSMAEALSAARADTERRIEEAVAEAARRRRQLETVLRDLDQGVMICTLDHKIMLYNRRALEMLHVSGDVGLGRLLIDVVGAQPIRHALDRVTQRYASGRHAAHPLGLGAPFVCATSDGASTLQGRLTLMLDEAAKEPVGYVVAFDDATDTLKANLQRDRLLRRIADELRPLAANLTSIAETLSEEELTEEERVAFRAQLRKDSELLSHRLDSFDTEARELVASGWPMSDVFSPTLYTSIIRRRTGPQNFSAEIIGEPVWLHCDSVAVVEMLDVALNRIADYAQIRAFTLEATPKDDRVYLDMSWRGAPIPSGVLSGWLDEALDPAVGGITPRELLALHRTDMWCETRGDGWARMRLPAPGPKEAHRGRAPTVDRRPEFYDFDLLNRSSADAREDAPLRDLDYVVFDTETTGLEPSGGDKLISVAGVRIVNGRVLKGEVFDQLIHPGRNIPAASTKIHHITNEMVQGAPDASVVLPRFHRFVSGSVLVAHNAAFDLKFLSMEEAASGVSFGNPVLDTVLLAAHLHGQNDSLTLDALAERFAVEIPPEARHTALGDSLATAEVLLHLFDMLDAVGVRTLGEALAASREAGAIRRRQAAY